MAIDVTAHPFFTAASDRGAMVLRLYPIELLVGARRRRGSVPPEPPASTGPPARAEAARHAGELAAA